MDEAMAEPPERPPTPPPGTRAKEEILRVMREKLRAAMTAEYGSCGDEAYTFARLQAETLIQKRFHRKEQKSYDDIPIFPNKDGISSNHTDQELESLLSQMVDHGNQVASVVISTQSGNLPVSPKSPASVFVLVPGPVDMKPDPVAAKTESTKDAKRAKTERVCAPRDAKIASKKHVEVEEKKEEIPGKDTYHIIRVVQQRLTKRYLDLMRRDSDGYITAFRILYNIDQSDSAYWCTFSDCSHLKIHLPFINIHVLNFGSGYGTAGLENNYYGYGTLDAIIDDFLVDLYGKPSMDRSVPGELYFQILIMVFGEAPRLDAIRKFIKAHSKIKNCFCADPRLHSLKLGPLLGNLMQKWSNTGDTALYLLQVLYEKFITEGILQTRSESFANAQFRHLFQQFEKNEIIAHTRCVEAVKAFENLFHLTKSADPSGKLFNYGELALYQLMNEQLRMVKHNEERVISLILRQRGFRQKISLPGCKQESNNIGKKSVESPDVVFWAHFDLFDKLKMISSIDLLFFLEEAWPFLKQYGFHQDVEYREIFKAVESILKYFNELRWIKEPGDVCAAAETAKSSGVMKWKTRYTTLIANFLRDRRVAPG